MFAEENFLKYKINTKDSSVGNVEVNKELLKAYDFYYPFIRENYSKTITKYGNRNPNVIEEYIVRCLNDYHTKLTTTTNTAERQQMLEKYMHLYSMWRELYAYKNAKDLVNTNMMYDLFLYELYTMGYVA